MFTVGVGATPTLVPEGCSILAVPVPDVSASRPEVVCWLTGLFVPLVPTGEGKLLTGVPIGEAVGDTVPEGPKMIELAVFPVAEGSAGPGSVDLAMPLVVRTPDGPNVIGAFDGGGGCETGTDTGCELEGETTAGGTPPVVPTKSVVDGNVGGIIIVGWPPVEAGESGAVKVGGTLAVDGLFSPGRLTRGVVTGSPA